MSLTTRDENLIEEIPDMRVRIINLEQNMPLNLALFDAINTTGGDISKNVPINIYVP